jgi:DNA-binding NtrC family response regulator
MVTMGKTHIADRLVGTSEAIRLIEADADIAARSDAHVLITGETGVGKEVVARLIHQRSARTRAALGTLTCAGLSDALLESELFGHMRGSFRGAYRDKPGLLEMAANGTLFLSEVEEMSARMQVLLLRFLESGEFQRIGAHGSPIAANVRIVAASHRDLEPYVANGTFREDLYFRLNVIRLSIPTLRERIEDIPPLAHHFLQSYCRMHQVPGREVSLEAMSALVAYQWPGNVRELKSVVERIVLKATGSVVRLADLPVDVTRSAAGYGFVE